MRSRKLSRGFRRLQAFCRAYRIRAKNSARVCDVVKRIQVAEKRAVADPSMKLGKRTQGLYLFIYMYLYTYLFMYLYMNIFIICMLTLLCLWLVYDCVGLDFVTPPL
jgi:hypothetical protein